MRQLTQFAYSNSVDHQTGGILELIIFQWPAGESSENIFARMLYKLRCQIFNFSLYTYAQRSIDLEPI